MSEVPAHARRAFRILGKVPPPAYHVVVDNQFLGEWVESKTSPIPFRFFTPRVFKTKEGACRAADATVPEKRTEVLECYGSFVDEDCAVVPCP